MRVTISSQPFAKDIGNRPVIVSGRVGVSASMAARRPAGITANDTMNIIAAITQAR